MRSVCAAASGLGMAAMLMASPAPAAAIEAVQGHSTASITAAGTARVVINELAPSGPRGSTDEFIELRNTGSEVAELHGWELEVCLAADLTVVLAAFPSSTEIRPGEHLLLASTGSSTRHAADFIYDGWDVPDDGGWLLFDPWSGYVDAVGLSGGLDCTDGDPAPPCDWVAGEAVTRDEQGTDTDDNAADFNCQPRTPRV